MSCKKTIRPRHFVWALGLAFVGLFTQSHAAPQPSGIPTSAYGAQVGLYAAEVLGSNPFGSVYYDRYIAEANYFFQLGAGAGTVQSSYSRSLFRAAVFENNLLISVEALVGYAPESPWYKAKGRAVSLIPHFTGGVVGIYQGTVPNVGLVAGFGNRMPLPFFTKNRGLALVYSLQDHIYSQKIGSRPALTHNLVVRIGVHMYR